jgi:magnesium-transporting ATPase (P-type)
MGSDETDKITYTSNLIRRFDFSSALQRMSVICKNTVDNKYRVFVKGSPEKISELCRPETMPQDYLEILEQYTVEGFRVIALAQKPLKTTFREVMSIKRDEIERDLEFLGLLVMENKLKPETTPVIENLQHCQIRTIMATGDNVLTAISVARQCCIIEKDKLVWLGDLLTDPNTGNKFIQWNSPTQKSNDLPWNYKDPSIEVALTGKAFNHVLQSGDTFLINSVLAKANVFARMGPDDKASLVEHLQQVLEESIGMCGDGANDCGALKTADVGISLSEAEASIAAPFTSAVQNIECVVTLLREGRAAMATSF